MEPEGNKKRLLIIDDVELFIQLEVSHLGHRRYEIHTASSGSDGLEKAHALKPDLILLDLLMPDMNGDQVSRILKDNPETSGIPIILVSSDTREHSRSIIDSSGCDALIYKPVRRDLLLSVVENLLKTNTREYERIEVTIPCTVTTEGETPLKATIHSLGSNGVFVESDRKLVRGDMMSLSFTLPSMGSMINVRTAAVVWCGALRGEGLPGFGVQFLTIAPDSSQQIEDFIRMQLGKEHAGADLPDGDEAGE